jgi:hypothetical protein
MSRLFAGRLVSDWLVLVLVLAADCSAVVRTKPDVEGAKKFSAFPLYWVGDRFERWDISTVEGLHGARPSS